MTKLCPRGKAAAKRKFKVYPSAYANAYASRICAGKIKDPSGVKRKDFKGPKKAMGGRIYKADGGSMNENPKSTTSQREKEFLKQLTKKTSEGMRKKLMGGGLIEATQRLKRQGLKGGGICKKGMNRKAVGTNS
jgi:hypothetical protein